MIDSQKVFTKKSLIFCTLLKVNPIVFGFSFFLVKNWWKKDEYYRGMFLRLLVKLSAEHLYKSSVLKQLYRFSSFQQFNISCMERELSSVKFRECAGFSSRGPVFKPLGDSRLTQTFILPRLIKWGRWVLALRQLNPIHKKWP